MVLARHLKVLLVSQLGRSLVLKENRVGLDLLLGIPVHIVVAVSLVLELAHHVLLVCGPSMPLS